MRASEIFQQICSKSHVAHTHVILTDRRAIVAMLHARLLVYCIYQVPLNELCLFSNQQA